MGMESRVADSKPGEARRVAFLDTAKGLGMLLIIWGHISGLGSAFIYAFHIPLFFFLSGMVFDSRKYPRLRDFLASRARRLLVPYLFYSVVTWAVYVVYALLSGEAGAGQLLMPLLQTFIAQGSGGFLVHNVPLWFVTCLFVTQVLYYHIDKLDARLSLLLSAALSALGYLMIAKFRFFNFKLLPWSIESALAAMIFYAVGNIVARRFGCERIERTLAGRRLGCLAAAVALGVCLSFGSRIVGHVSLGSDELRGGLLYYIDAFCGTAMVLLASIALDSGRISDGGGGGQLTVHKGIT